MTTRIILTYADVRTDLRTDEPLTVEGVEPFARVAYDYHVKALVTVEQLEQA